MTPVSPIVTGFESQEVIYAKDQPQYTPLPALKCNDETGTVITKWRLSWRERIQVLFSGSIWLYLMTFDRPLQPVLLRTTEPELTKREND